MTFKSITARVVFSILPIIAVTIVAFIIFTYNTMLSQTGETINEKMIENVDVSSLSMQLELMHNANVTDNMAVYAAVAEVRPDELAAFVENSIASNPNTVGGGIWYEPYIVNPEEEHYSAYAYREGSGLRVTMDYHRTVDYFNELWYTRAVEAQGKLVWSGVYHDPVADVIMVTSSRAFFDDMGAVLGVSTADMALTNIRSIVGNISVGETGRAFVVGQGGEYISYLDDSRSIEDIILDDPNLALAALGAEFAKNGSGIYEMELDGKYERVYYERLPSVDWTLVVMVDAAEIRASAIDLVLLMSIVPIVGLALAGIAIVMVTRHIKHVLNKVNSFADAAASGNLTTHIEDIEPDEFGDMETHLNEMIDSMAESKRRSEEALMASNAKSSFLSSMSHEIRTPMNAILGMTQIAQSSQDIKKIKDCLDKTSAASKQLLGLINDILDMSKIEANKLELNNEVFDLYAVVANVQTIIEIKAEEKRQRLTVSLDSRLPVYVLGDEMRLSQVFINLLSNAVKFTPDGGSVSLSLSVGGELDNDRIELLGRVTDNGIGVTKEQAEKIFESFEQADSGIARRFGGTGLGLSICKKIIELMGGTIDVESAPGEGSAFIFNARVGKCDSYTSVDMEPQDDSAPDFTGKTILLADDIEINREIVTAMLESTGAVIEQAENGMQALSMFKAAPNKYSIILMDVNMPEMDGFEATRKIRACPGGEDIPIIALTASAFQSDVKQALEAGMNGHIAKPIDLSQLYAQLRANIK